MKKIIITLFLICIFCYYLTWTISQPFNSCPDEGMKWDICKYIYENNKLPHGEDEAIRVMSLNPPAARFFISSSLVSCCFTKC